MGVGIPDSKRIEFQYYNLQYKKGATKSRTSHSQSHRWVHESSVLAVRYTVSRVRFQKGGRKVQHHLFLKTRLFLIRLQSLAQFITCLSGWVTCWLLWADLEDVMPRRFLISTGQAGRGDSWGGLIPGWELNIDIFVTVGSESRVSVARHLPWEQTPRHVRNKSRLLIPRLSVHVHVYGERGRSHSGPARLVSWHSLVTWCGGEAEPAGAASRGGNVTLVS